MCTNLNEFNECEKKILTILGSLNISVKKNVHKEKILMKIPKQKRKEAEKAIDKLRTKGYIQYYRAPDNYCVPQKGRDVTHKLYKESLNEKYKNLTITKR